MTSSASQYVITLPGGYLNGDGIRHREVELAPLSGREEELLMQRSMLNPAALITEVLCHSVLRIGDIKPISPEIAGQLLIADRQYVLLKLREITFGDRVEGTISCPWPQCGAKIDIDFSINDVPVSSCEDLKSRYALTFSAQAIKDDSISANWSFRLPNGSDQEEVAPLLNANPAAALTRLFQRCLFDATGQHAVDPEIVSNLSALARLELEKAMARCAPEVELNMDLSCPECKRSFTMPFDLQDFFFGELRTSRDLLYRQVHYLAYHYHWSEQEIMDMPRQKRLKYIEILADEIEAMNEALS